MGRASTVAPAKAEVGTKAVWWDRLGVGVSLLCLVHCLALPVIASGVWLVIPHEDVHLWLFFVLVPLVLLSAIPGYRHHRRKSVLWLFGLGTAMVAGALSLHAVVGPAGEVVGTVAGSLLLIAGHALSWKHRLHTHHAHAHL